MATRRALMAGSAIMVCPSLLSSRLPQSSCDREWERAERLCRKSDVDRGGTRKIVWAAKTHFAPPNLLFPYTHQVKGGQFGGGGKNIFLPRKITFLPRLHPPWIRHSYHFFATHNASVLATLLPGAVRAAPPSRRGSAAGMKQRGGEGRSPVRVSPRTGNINTY